MKPRFQLEGVQFAAPPKNANTPKWNKLFPSNTTRYRADFPEGHIDFTPEFFQAMLDNWSRGGSPALPVDYSHDESGIASGWIEGLELRDDGLYAAIRWTDAARQFITNDELRYLSSTFATDGEDPTTGAAQGPTLYGAALLNTPFLQDLPRVVGARLPHHALTKPATKEKQMDPTELAKQICTLLGLPTGTANDTMLTALSKALSPTAVNANPGPAAVPGQGPAAVKTGNPHVGDVPSANTRPDNTPSSPVLPTSVENMLPDGDNEESSSPDSNAPISKTVQHPVSMSAEAKRLHLENKALAARVERLERDRFDAALTQLSDKLVREGRIVAVQRNDVREYAVACGLEKASAFYSRLPVVTPVGEVGVTGEHVEVADAKKADAFFTKVEELQAKHGLTLLQATRRVRKESPELVVSMAPPPDAQHHQAAEVGLSST